jgi:hypothetical protein
MGYPSCTEAHSFYVLQQVAWSYCDIIFGHRHASCRLALVVQCKHHNQGLLQVTTEQIHTQDLRRSRSVQGCFQWIHSMRECGGGGGDGSGRKGAAAAAEQRGGRRDREGSGLSATQRRPFEIFDATSAIRRWRSSSRTARFFSFRDRLPRGTRVPPWEYCIASLEGRPLHENAAFT